MASRRSGLLIGGITSVLLVGVAFAAPGSPLQQVLPIGKKSIAEITSNKPKPHDIPVAAREALKTSPGLAGKSKAEIQTMIERGQLPGKFIDVGGPQTTGTEIVLAGKKLRLPPDTSIGMRISEVFCMEGKPCPKAPLIVLQRGNSKIWISEPTGQITQRLTAPGEEHAFDFLQEAGVGQ